MAESKRSKWSKMFQNPFKKKKTVKNKDELHHMMENTATQHTEATDGNSCTSAGEPESTVDEIPSGSSVEVSGEKGLDILKTILSEQSNPPAMPKINFPQERDKYLEEIGQFVDRHFPMLPAEGLEGSQSQQILNFLLRTKSLIHAEVLRLTPALRDAGLLDHLKDCYSRHLFTSLKLLLNRHLSVKELFCLLQWGVDLFFSSEIKLTVHDPLQLTGEIERAKQKLLQELQKQLSTYLESILRYDEEHGHKEDSMNEETFNSVHIDVIQHLDSAITDAEKVGLTLKDAVKILCNRELQGFVQKYENAENKRLKRETFTEKNSVHLFRIINTCMQLRCFAEQITPDIENSDVYSSTKHMLDKLQTNAESIVEKVMNCLAQVNLNSYFKKRNRNIDILMEAIQRQCASLPETASEVKKVIVEIAYKSVSKMYLKCLMKTNRNQEHWENAEDKIKEDVGYFQETFSELNGTVTQENQLLQGMTEVLHCSDVEAQKINCCVLYETFPDESKQYVPGLLRWMGKLSEWEVKEVLDVIREKYPSRYPSPTCVTCCPLKILFCCK